MWITCFFDVLSSCYCCFFIRLMLYLLLSPLSFRMSIFVLCMFIRFPIIFFCWRSTALPRSKLILFYILILSFYWSLIIYYLNKSYRLHFPKISLLLITYFILKRLEKIIDFFYFLGPTHLVCWFWSYRSTYFLFFAFLALHHAL